MSTETLDEVFYWGSIPAGATVITSCARKIEGRMVIQALVKNDTADIDFAATQIPLSSVLPGQEVYVSPPTGEGSILVDTQWRLTTWTPQTQTAIRRSIAYATSRQPLRGTVPALIEKDPVVVTRGLDDFPAECFIGIVRKASSVRGEPTLLLWRRWTQPDGTARNSLVGAENVPPGTYVYVRADYLEHDEPLVQPLTGHTFLPVAWESYWLERINWDATCRTALHRRDVWKMRIDRVFLWINIAVLLCQGGIMLVDRDKRTDPRQIAWTALVGTAAWSSKQQVAYNEWFLAERMR